MERDKTISTEVIYVVEIKLRLAHGYERKEQSAAIVDLVFIVVRL
jgi:hypothetical protein